MVFHNALLGYMAKILEIYFCDVITSALYYAKKGSGNESNLSSLLVKSSTRINFAYEIFYLTSAPSKKRARQLFEKYTFQGKNCNSSSVYLTLHKQNKFLKGKLSRKNCSQV